MLLNTGGYFADMLLMPWWINWVRYLSYWYYSLALFFDIAVKPFGVDEVMDQLNTQYSFSQMSSSTNVMCMIAYAVVFRVISYFVLLTTRKLEFK